MARATTKTGKVEKNTRPGKTPGRPYADLWSRPGYLVRRLHQISIGLFAEECQQFNITPVQYALLTVLYSGCALDQITVSTEVGVDRTSGSDVIRRLGRRGLLMIIPSAEDRRAKLVQITVEGKSLVQKMQASMEEAQARLIAPLTPQEQMDFERIMQKIILANDSASRAPSPKNLTTLVQP